MRSHLRTAVLLALALFASLQFSVAANAGPVITLDDTNPFGILSRTFQGFDDPPKLDGHINEGPATEFTTGNGSIFLDLSWAGDVKVVNDTTFGFNILSGRENDPKHPSDTLAVTFKATSPPNHNEVIVTFISGSQEVDEAPDLGVPPINGGISLQSELGILYFSPDLTYALVTDAAAGPDPNKVATSFLTITFASDNPEPPSIVSWGLGAAFGLLAMLRHKFKKS